MRELYIPKELGVRFYFDGELPKSASSEGRFFERVEATVRHCLYTCNDVILRARLEPEEIRPKKST